MRRQVSPLSVEGYHQLRDLGAISEKTELLNGVIVEKMTKSPFHEYLSSRRQALLSRDLPDGLLLRKEGPLTFAGSEPEPDLSLVSGSIEDFREAHPACAELVIEIAVTSMEIDRAKGELYAAAKVPFYWLLIANEKRVEVYTQPQSDGYAEKRVYGADDHLQTPFGTRIRISDLF